MAGDTSWVPGTTKGLVQVTDYVWWQLSLKLCAFSTEASCKLFLNVSHRKWMGVQAIALQFVGQVTAPHMSIPFWTAWMTIPTARVVSISTSRLDFIYTKAFKTIEYKSYRWQLWSFIYYKFESVTFSRIFQCWIDQNKKWKHPPPRQTKKDQFPNKRHVQIQYKLEI